MPEPLAEILTPDKALIFRITHRDNLLHILENGVHCRNSTVLDPGFVAIGHPDIIARRKARAVEVGPGGDLADYVPFYFTPCTPMLYNIVTGWKGLQRRAPAEVVILVSSVDKLEEHGVTYLVADRNATLVNAILAPGCELLPGLGWENWQKRDFEHDPEDPGKIERYQAEVLVHRHLPAAALRAIITHDRPTQLAVRQHVAGFSTELKVAMMPSWYP
ncbi:MAG: DUF4433 domain-containing protein [Gemmatimonadales bacterium]|nr:DUF4433 domain-containing protein [Gemmatimonadales bacterium]